MQPMPARSSVDLNGFATGHEVRQQSAVLGSKEASLDHGDVAHGWTSTLDEPHRHIPEPVETGFTASNIVHMSMVYPEQPFPLGMPGLPSSLGYTAAHLHQESFDDSQLQYRAQLQQPVEELPPSPQLRGSTHMAATQSAGRKVGDRRGVGHRTLQSPGRARDGRFTTQRQQQQQASAYHQSHTTTFFPDTGHFKGMNQNLQGPPLLQTRQAEVPSRRAIAHGQLPGKGVKRKAGDRQDEDYDGHENETSAGKYQGSSRGKFMACPFYLQDPMRFSNCQLRNKLKTPGQVNQHLKRSHGLPISCPACYEVFRPPKEKERCDRHIRERRCKVNEQASPILGLDKEQLSELDRVNIHVKGDTLGCYMRLWEIVFPNVSAPTDPYVYGGGPDYTIQVAKVGFAAPTSIGVKTIHHLLTSTEYEGMSFEEKSIAISQEVIRAITALCEQLSDDQVDGDQEQDDKDGDEPEGEEAKPKKKRRVARPSSRVARLKGLPDHAQSPLALSAGRLEDQLDETSVPGEMMDTPMDAPAITYRRHVMERGQENDQIHQAQMDMGFIGERDLVGEFEVLGRDQDSS